MMLRTQDPDAKEPIGVGVPTDQSARPMTVQMLEARKTNGARADAEQAAAKVGVGATVEAADMNQIVREQDLKKETRRRHNLGGGASMRGKTSCLLLGSREWR